RLFLTVRSNPLFSPGWYLLAAALERLDHQDEANVALQKFAALKRQEIGNPVEPERSEASV
ncbi:MAG: hypothetical protein KDD53_10525, partial [Bdellovibrionales bacterium]|nr:hypothetical protein [Bdellovibrionales bacterium]